MTMAILEQLTAAHLPATYNPFPQGRFVTLVLIRKTESETIFRTEGSGEGLVKETTLAGRGSDNRIRRVVISKRKQTAVERRTGRDLLRQHGFLRTEGEGACIFNTANPCGNCIDCMVYGFAVGTGGAQKSRVLTDDAFSIGPSGQVADRRTFNGLYDNSTMRHPTQEGRASTSINEDEYVKPEVHFLDLQTLKDVTPAELTYVVGNVLRSTRYGAISSRLGRVKNELMAIILSDCEMFSNLELTQTVYDSLLADQPELDFPLGGAAVRSAVAEAIATLLPEVPSVTPVSIEGQQLTDALRELRATYATAEGVTELLGRIAAGYRPS